MLLLVCDEQLLLGLPAWVCCVAVKISTEDPSCQKVPTLDRSPPKIVCCPEWYSVWTPCLRHIYRTFFAELEWSASVPSSRVNVVIATCHETKLSLLALMQHQNKFLKKWQFIHQWWLSSNNDVQCIKLPNQNVCAEWRGGPLSSETIHPLNRPNTPRKFQSQMGFPHGCYRRLGCSSVGRASDPHAANTGSIPWCGKGFFF